MWMKSVPYCTYSTFEQSKKQNRVGAISSSTNDFNDIPNYKLTSKAFDAQHLDRFINKLNMHDSTNFASALVS